MKKLKMLLLFLLITVMKVNGQGNLYFRFDGESIDANQWYLNSSGSQESYSYQYPCLLGASVTPRMRTLDKNIFITVPISQLVQYDVMTIQDFCQRCATLGAPAQNAWLKPYVLAYPNYKIFVVHINHANQTAKIVQVKWDAWE